MECPDWFDLKNYTPSYKRLYWQFQISSRIYLRDVTLREDESTNSPSELFAENLKVIFEIRVSDEETVEQPSSARLLDLSHLSRIRSLMMEPKVVDAMGELNELDELSYLSFEEFNKYEDFKQQSLLSFLKNEEAKYMPIVIDPHADMSSILNDVEALVIRVREVNSSPTYKKPIGRKEFAAWFTYGVLPCWDLILWCQLTGQEVTNSELGDLLWPNANVDRAERVRKTTKRKFSEVVSNSTLGRLEYF
jgi:hypothetical protein